ncbi:MAG: hypothetical protein OXG47_00490 [bacterium]|nr:hypothetical protein [bacterium]
MVSIAKSRVVFLAGSSERWRAMAERHDWNTPASTIRDNLPILHS